ncbi:MAG TPA: TadE family protein [Candidatus Limnocylindria bacterium]|nr:TadE family protein [Candidatus Limnocylindria bacterium]
MRMFRRDEGAQSLVEFALILPLFLLVITGLFDVGRAVWQENTLAYAAREGTRYAIVHGSASTSPVYPGNTQPVVDVVRAAAVGVPNVSVFVDWPDIVGGVRCYDRSCTVVVDATAPFVPIPSQYLLGSTFNITLRGGSKLVIQR